MPPADPEIGAAAAAYRAGRLDEAEALFHEILRRRADDPDALHFLGLVRYRRGDTAKALELVRESLRVAPENARVWNNLGNLLLEERQLEAARQAFEEAIRLAPEMPSGWSNLGICLRRQGKAGAAIAAYRKAIEIEPGFAPALENLGIALDGVGRTEEATEVYRQWLAHDPDAATARHMLAARTGLSVPSRAEDRYVSALFDRYASTFDDHLASLGYRAPDILASALADFAPPAAEPIDVLDAGCGTGLCGPFLRARARTLTGVDLSPGMIARARKRGIYDELAVGELCQFMRSRPGAFDAVIAADALVYFGALGEVLAAARACLRLGGIVAFTLEALESGSAPEGYQLAPHGRYCHAAAYVREALAAAGFRDPRMTTAVLRREVGRDVQGHVALARAGEPSGAARGGAAAGDGASAP